MFMKTLLASVIGGLLTFPAVLAAADSTLTTAPSAAASDLKVADPYAKDGANSPWNRRMQRVEGINGVVIPGRASGVSLPDGLSFDTFTPYMRNDANLVEGSGTTTVGVGCDGINLGSVMQGQLGMYQHMVEEFIRQAPTLAVMFLAYSQPTIKSVIDELNGVSQFGLDLTNVTCSGVRAMADDSLEEKKQTMAEAECTSEAGFKDPECMSGSGISGNLVKIMKTAKSTVADRASALTGGITSATGGLVKFTGKIGGTSIGGSGAPGSPGSTTGFTSRNCSSDVPNGVLGLILGSSEISCEDMKSYAGLFPNYDTKDDVTGVIPRKMTVLDVSKVLAAQYYQWIMSAVATPNATLNENEGFKAMVNRIGLVLSDKQHVELQSLSQKKPSEFLAKSRNMAMLAAKKDMTGIIGRMEVAVLTGIQNQQDNEFLTDRVVNNYQLAINTLHSELNSINRQIEVDVAFKQTASNGGE